MMALFAVGFRSLFADHLPILLVVLLGGAAVYLLLPRPRGVSPWLGAALGAVALVLGGVTLLRTTALTPEAVLFYTFSAIAIVAGTLLVTQRNPARAALAFALVVLSTCGLFLLLAAPFLMAATIIVYAGAIVVTFLFVIMLAQQEGLSSADQRSREPLLACLAGFLLLGMLLYVLAVLPDPKRIERFQEVHEFQARIDALRSSSNDLPGPANQETRELLEEIEIFLAQLRTGSREEPLEPSAAQLGGEELDRAVMKAEDVVGRQQTVMAVERPIEWDRVSEALARVAGRLTSLPPGSDVPLSDLSGPAPNEDIRRDAQGRPQLPADNVAYLGRSLYTDYLIAVELGGTLLLVATIGAIAIAQRRPEGA